MVKEALTDYGDAKKDKLGLPESKIHNLEFFFKKSWDKFTEPLLEYDELMKGIEEKQWESRGAKSRATNALEERRKAAEAGLKEILPDTEVVPSTVRVNRVLTDKEKLKKTLARIYEGYAACIKDKEGLFEKLAEDVGRGLDLDLRAALGVWGSRPQKPE